LRILIVEDEFWIAIELSGLLEDSGYNVIGPASTIAEALAVLGRDHPDACVLDVNLRGEHSAPVAQALRDHGVPFLLSSAYDAVTLNQHIAFQGVVNIGKPAPPEKLLATLAAFRTT
jgi:DNA-binding response OmpR family regulator